MSFGRLSYKPVLICGNVLNLEAAGVEFLETDVTTTSVSSILAEFFILTRLIRKLDAEVVCVGSMRHALALMIPFFRWRNRPLKRIKNGHHSSARTPIWILKLDWDGRLDLIISPFSRLAKVILLLINSLVFDYVAIETTCARDCIGKIPMINGKKLLFLPHGYSVEHTRKAEYDQIARKKVILCVSRISPEKGLDTLINAFAAIESEFPDWGVRFVGPVTNTEYYRILQSHIAQFHLNGRVQFVGYLDEDNLYEEYVSASVFCLPSIRESFGNVRIEAMAMGLPVITSDSPCGKDFADMGAIVFQAGDVEALTDSLKILLSDGDVRSQIARNEQHSIRSYDEITRDLLDQIGGC